MLVFENKSFKVESANIKQDYSGNYKELFFVDTLNGGNICNFESKDKAIEYARENEARGW